MTAVMPKGTALLLDMDGVLAEVSRSYRTAIVETCKHYGATSISLDIIAEWKARGGCNNDWKLSLDLINTDPNGKKGLTLDQVTETFERFYQGNPDNGISGLCELETLIPKKSTLEEICKRISKDRMAIVTGRPRKDCDKFLRLHRIDHMFGACVCMEDGPAKPDPFPVVRACELLGIKPSLSVIMVGDTPDDIRAGLAAGCTGVGVSTPENAESAAKEGKDHDSGALCTAMKECGEGVVVVQPGFDALLDSFSEVE
jgi:HAD superfamily hydrolase (TIGR01548 family)